MDDFRPIYIPLLQDSKFWVKKVGARAHLQQWLLRPYLENDRWRPFCEKLQTNMKVGIDLKCDHHVYICQVNPLVLWLIYFHILAVD